MGNVIAVCISEQKGTQKKNVGSARFIEDWGIENDAHAGKWHRQVSLLSHDKIEAFRARGAKVKDGAFGENLVVSGIDFRTLPIGTRFTCNDVELELTQIGKECHSHCEIYKVMGECIMPREGVFARVLHGGTISVGDTLAISYLPFRAAVLTASDSGSRGEREDLSTPAAKECLKAAGFTVVKELMLPDDRQQLADTMREWCDSGICDLLVTTGGTGFSPRDCTPEATLDVAERLCPGIPEALRAYSLSITPRAMLSRAQAGIRKQTLIVNLPGSPKAVKECLEYALPALHHGLEILLGRAANCARK